LTEVAALIKVLDMISDSVGTLVALTAGDCITAVLGCSTMVSTAAGSAVSISSSELSDDDVSLDESLISTLVCRRRALFEPAIAFTLIFPPVTGWQTEMSLKKQDKQDISR